MNEQERLIREAIAAEADQAVDYRAVLSDLHRAKPRRRPIALFAAIGVAAAVAAVAVIVPLGVDRGAAPGTVDPAAPPAGQAPAQNVLLIGLDEVTNTDSVVLARLGPDGTASAASLPRDSWVDIPGVGMGRLNSAYARAHSAAQAEGRDGHAAGAEALVLTVEALTGTQVDHYASVDMAGFGALADAVGGVEVCLRTAAKDQFSGIDLPAGRHSLDGAQSLAFLRQRHGLHYGDLDRITRHQVFLRSLATKVIRAGDVAKLNELVEVVRANVRTDPGWNPLELARHLNGTVRTATIPVGEVIDSEAGARLAVDPAAVRTFTAGFFADQPATPSTTPDGSPVGTPAQPTPEDGCVD
ncbi:LCP family protein [Saccharothrix sp. NRRL B-16314]|uniref:LCP family protein n=1 Tax=Saccharothrix sp. NRRL B-16314 TaxID=1463825 RepID=UPI00068D36C0|nr:LCP family protein [Saccharothrix sp. NRRL B-16314]